MTTEAPVPGDTSGDPTRAIRDAIQNSMAARLGRGFVPLGFLFIWGVVGMIRGRPGADVLAFGAVATSVIMLGYGLRIVRRAFGHDSKLWMKGVALLSVVPPLYSLYLLVWMGLRTLSASAGVGGFVAATLNVTLGVWVLRSWMNVVEVERLAQVMVVNPDGKEGPA